MLVWALVAAAAMFWGWRLWSARLPVPAQAQTAVTDGNLVGDLNRLLGAPPSVPTATVAAPEASARFQLTGVVATPRANDSDTGSAPGIALIAVDGKPPRAFRVGDALDASLVLQAVGLRSARIAPSAGGEGFVLNLPPPPVAATGVPSFAGAAEASSAMAGAAGAYGAGSADLQPVGVSPGMMAAQAAAQAALAQAQAQAAAQAAALQQGMSGSSDPRQREQRQ